MSPARTPHPSPARWIAGATGLTGAICLMLLLLAEQAELERVYPAAALFVVGTILFVKLSMTPARWGRTVNGPEARRFVAISLAVACLLLLAGVVVLIGWVVQVAE